MSSFPSLWLEKAILVPSGDHFGPHSSARLSVSLFSPVPSGRTVKISKPIEGPRSRMKARRAPEGTQSSAGPTEDRAGATPAAAGRIIAEQLLHLTCIQVDGHEVPVVGKRPGAGHPRHDETVVGQPLRLDVVEIAIAGEQRPCFLGALSVHDPEVPGAMARLRALLALLSESELRAIRRQVGEA